MRSVIGSLFPDPRGEDIPEPQNGFILFAEGDGSFGAVIVHSTTQAQEFLRSKMQQPEDELLRQISTSALPRATDDALNEFGGQSARALVAAFVRYKKTDIAWEFTDPYPTVTLCAAWPAVMLAPSEEPNMLFGYLDEHGEPKLVVIWDKAHASVVLDTCTWMPHAVRARCDVIIRTSALPDQHVRLPMRIHGYAAGALLEMLAAANSM